jgi:hypothetical protein
MDIGDADVADVEFVLPSKTDHLETLKFSLESSNTKIFSIMRLAGTVIYLEGLGRESRLRLRQVTFLLLPLGLKEDFMNEGKETMKAFVGKPSPC